MTITYLIEVDLADISAIHEVSEDIADAVASTGIAVTSVKPWARPVTLPQTAAQTGYPVPPPVL